MQWAVGDKILRFCGSQRPTIPTLEKPRTICSNITKLFFSKTKAVRCRSGALYNQWRRWPSYRTQLIQEHPTGFHRQSQPFVLHLDIGRPSLAVFGLSVLDAKSPCASLEPPEVIGGGQGFDVGKKCRPRDGVAGLMHREFPVWSATACSLSRTTCHASFALHLRLASETQAWPRPSSGRCPLDARSPKRRTRWPPRSQAL